MTPAEAADLADRWHADQQVDPAEIGAALNLLTQLLEQWGRPRAKIDELIPPVARLRDATEKANAYLAETAQPDKFPRQQG